MPDQDPLTGRFDQFREASIARSQPPGVTAIRRTVVRRRAGRTLAAVAVLALLGGSALWLSRSSQPSPPAGFASPSPSESTWAMPSPTPQSTASESAGSDSPGAPPGGPTKTPSRTPSPCSTATPIVRGGTDRYDVRPSDYFTHCPQARIRIYGALYAWDVNRQQYTLAHTTNVDLTAADPTAPLTALDPPPGTVPCGSAYIRAQAGDNDPPASYPASLVISPSSIPTYWTVHGLGTVLDWQADTPTAADLASMPACQRPTGTASPTPTR